MEYGKGDRDLGRHDPSPRDLATRRGASDPRRRRHGIAALGAIAVALVAVVIAVLLVGEGPDYSKPIPEFPSLTAQPDATLHGTVAYVVMIKDVIAKKISECARVSLASGSASKDVLCWRFDHSAPVTVNWLADHQLLVTGFKNPSKNKELTPQWAKTVNVSSRASRVVPASDLGKGAFPPSGPTTNAAGEAVIATGKDGNLTLSVQGQANAQTLLVVRDSNAGWGIKGVPIWSRDGTWILWSDGSRILVTTSGAHPSTRVLASAEVFALAADYGAQPFSKLDADLPLS